MRSGAPRCTVTICLHRKLFFILAQTGFHYDKRYKKTDKEKRRIVPPFFFTKSFVVCFFIPPLAVSVFPECALLFGKAVPSVSARRCFTVRENSFILLCKAQFYVSEKRCPLSPHGAGLLFGAPAFSRTAPVQKRQAAAPVHGRGGFLNITDHSVRQAPSPCGYPTKPRSITPERSFRSSRRANAGIPQSGQIESRILRLLKNKLL